jgi:hypothetical protein
VLLGTSGTAAGLALSLRGDPAGFVQASWPRWLNALVQVVPVLVERSSRTYRTWNRCG